MNKIATKIPAMIGMLLSVLSFSLVIGAFIVSANEAPSETGITLSFALWVFSVMAAFGSMIFYFVDAILSIKKAAQRINKPFNIILATAIMIGIPMVIYVGGGLGINILIWNIYHLMLFILEAVSIALHIKASRQVKREIGGEVI